MMILQGRGYHIVLGNALVDMYVKCDAVSKVRQVCNGLPSRDVVFWTAVIAGYVQVGHAERTRWNYLYMHLESMYHG